MVVMMAETMTPLPQERTCPLIGTTWPLKNLLWITAPNVYLEISNANLKNAI